MKPCPGSNVPQGSDGGDDLFVRTISKDEYIEQLEEALFLYADPSNWESKECDDGSYITLAYDGDGWEPAADALGIEDEGRDSKLIDRMISKFEDGEIDRSELRSHIDAMIREASKPF